MSGGCSEGHLLRLAHVLLTACAFLASGCSAWIANCGTDIHTVTTREQANLRFGIPCASGTTNGQPYEEFRTRQKISEPFLAHGNGVGFVMSFGVSELFAFPYELYLLGRRTLLGQNLRFTYDRTGSVTEVLLDWERHVPWPLEAIAPVTESQTDESERSPPEDKPTTASRPPAKRNDRGR